MSESVRDMLAREAAEAQARADAEERGEVTPTPGQRGRRRAEDPSQVYAVRIPVSRLRRLREVATDLGIQPSTLIRQWVIERLDALDASGISPLDEAMPPIPGELKLGPRRVPVGYEPGSGRVRPGSGRRRLRA
jgi:hypothetical protein